MRESSAAAFDVRRDFVIDPHRTENAGSDLCARAKRIATCQNRGLLKLTLLLVFRNSQGSRDVFQLRCLAAVDRKSERPVTI